ncbi:hypothetical protein [Actinocorallia longicatena]|uniref:Lipoprotein n=1 Tax=Actinocorallia longicatena TaxID=111803 RepID=A0ABP6QHT8_9ACTN
MKVRMRSLVAAALLTALTACSSEEERPAVTTNRDLPLAYPKDVATLLSRFGSDVLLGLGAGLRFKNENVRPSPCGDGASVKQVPGRNAGLDSWWVDHSPYSEAIDTYVVLPSLLRIAPGLVRVRDALTGSGWRVVEEHAGSSLRLAAPQDGYTATFEAITSVPGSPRIGVTISSPCLRHPDAR